MEKMSQTTEIGSHNLPSKDVALHRISSIVNEEESVTSDKPKLSTKRATSIVVCVAFVNVLSSIVNGMFTIEIPSIAHDVHLSEKLLLWPQSIVSLVSACTLLLSGSLTDVLGNKLIYLVGSCLQAAFMLGAGLSRTGTQIFVCRGFMGLAQSMCLTSSVSIIMGSFPAGRLRNIAFASMGGGQPLGFSLGLVLAGVFTETIGWRFGLYLIAGLNAGVVVLAAFSVHKNENPSSKTTLARLKGDVDWVGAITASISLALLCYVLASISADTSSIKSPSRIVLLVISIILMPFFAFWMRRQVRHRRPALIPNSLWRTRVFTCICLSIFFVWGAFNAFEQLFSLWLQLVQHNDPIQTSIRCLPSTVEGVIVNATMGLFVHRFSVYWITIISIVVSCTAPILMAVSGAHWIYWAAGFPSNTLVAVGNDVFYTIGLLIISSKFPDDSQGLTGGVFNTMAQVGKSVALALSAVITNAAIHGEASDMAENSLADAYRGGFWLCLGLNVATLVLCVWGLRNIGRIGKKNEGTKV